MAKKPRTAITPTRDEDFAQWYQQVIKAADMAENSPVRGCMIIKPYGFALWENMQRIFDGWLKDYGVQNTSFPLLIPLSFLEKEAEHIDGFAKECAVVTHHRLESSEKGLVPAGKLEEPYVIRPTSETMIGDAMSRWIQSYRDLPMKLNQWSNVMRWEMRTRLFLRTSEFFWHEGHNAFETPEEAKDDCLTVLKMYEKFFEEYLAFSGFMGVKTADERFPGALETYSFEAMMQDGKALQAATTHDLGQTFSRSCNIKFQGRGDKEEFAYTTSWAFSTRAIGGMIMIHADDDGMIMPPRVAPYQIIILPFIKDNSEEILEFADKLAAQIKEKGLRVHIDKRDMRTPDKMWDAVKKGVPIRVEIGAREMENGEITYVRRDIGRASKETLSTNNFLSKIENVLDDIHDNMLARSKEFRDNNVKDVDSLKDVISYFKNDANIGFVRADIGMMEDNGFEEVLKEYSLSTRCMPFTDNGRKVLIGKAY